MFGIVTLESSLDEGEVSAVLTSLRMIRGVLDVSLSADDLFPTKKEGVIIGYARVSKGDSAQSTEAQIASLRAAGVQVVYKEAKSGGRWDRPELQKMLEALCPGDVVVVHRMDRLSRSLKDLLLILDKVESKGARIRSLTEAVETETPAGRMLMQMLGVFAEFERSMVRERTLSGLESARRKGRIGGRPPSLSPEQRREVLAMVAGGETQAQVARVFQVSRSSVSRLVAANSVVVTGPEPRKTPS